MVRTALFAVLLAGAVAASSLERPVDANKALTRRQFGVGGFGVQQFQSSFTQISTQWSNFQTGFGGLGQGAIFQNLAVLIQQSISTFQIITQLGGGIGGIFQAQAAQQIFIQTSIQIIQTLILLSQQIGGPFFNFWSQSAIAIQFVQILRTVFTSASQFLSFGFLQNILQGQALQFLQPLGLGFLQGIGGVGIGGGFVGGASSQTVTTQSSSQQTVAGGGFLKSHNKDKKETKA